ncbi:lytic transglycosylase domain-containing protein [Alcanivorax quisquiliarum]|uniref:Lytic transglycosylase domain-containing protein n=1 Tax=Alcanivorax quisquiliarum TaxID=2933565 RepID=A0ABT0E3U8_9GAMM|nr:lytic transglycosylase domain-containing protein [Alcanivorax quisquiliarum]MCK0536369.1 lytic transglycosylase domain-containing protein [Alcanivorax quisquiliarum]
MNRIRLITLVTGLLAVCLPGYAEADTIYQFRSPDGTPLFTDRSVMPGGYELLSIRKGWDFTPRALSTDLRDLYDLEIRYAARSHSVEPGLIKAVIHAESLFDRHAVSRVGAQGLMQLMPQTAAFLDVSNPFDPRQNISGGARFLSYLMERFDSLEHVLAAYNAGEGNVRRYGGVPPFEETRRYVKKVQELLPRYRAHFEQDDQSNTLAAR